jgi:hypothetical protein
VKFAKALKFAFLCLSQLYARIFNPEIIQDVPLCHAHGPNVADII